jgi:carboxymethylenebutenolidase
MNKIISVVIAFIILVLGLYWYWDTNVYNAPEQEIKNVEMLVSDNQTPIIIEPEVAYFEGAKGYFVRPATEAVYPGVVIIHENRGLRPEIKTMAEQLAKEGYMVLAVDLLGRVVETQDEARALTAVFDQKKGVDNMKAAVAYLKGQGAQKVASLGWCFGGAQSLQLALSGQQMDATLIYYGRLATTTTALAPIKWPVLGIFGEIDQSISTSSVRLFESSLDTLGIENEIYIYPEVGHAFANPSGMNYAPEATKDAWEKTVAFLKKHL